ncbi:hypothetical protein A2U01_0034292, partial [Trifolium medium]|nr:hypothetical protein [Trifolium medium]
MIKLGWLEASKFFKSTESYNPGVEEGTVYLVGCPKNPRATGGKKFSGVRRDRIRGSKRVCCKLVQQHGGWWEVGTIINLKARDGRREARFHVLVELSLLVVARSAFWLARGAREILYMLFLVCCSRKKERERGFQ